jgi:hypothetical protein
MEPAKEHEMGFRVSGLSAEPFKSLYGLTDEQLAHRGVKRYVVDKKPGFPDRIEMREGEVGETMLLLNHQSQSNDTPYKASHAIFVREGATATYEQVNEIPEVMRTRLLSLRAFDSSGMMLDADVVEGNKVEAVIEHMFVNANVNCIHVHNAKQGCFSGQIDRA